VELSGGERRPAQATGRHLTTRGRTSRRGAYECHARVGRRLLHFGAPCDARRSRGRPSDVTLSGSRRLVVGRGQSTSLLGRHRFSGSRDLQKLGWWWAHLVGALRVYPHKHWANHPPKKIEDWRVVRALRYADEIPNVSEMQ